MCKVVITALIKWMVSLKIFSNISSSTSTISLQMIYPLCSRVSFTPSRNPLLNSQIKLKTPGPSSKLAHKISLREMRFLIY